MTNQTVDLGTQKVIGLEAVEGMRDGSTFVMQTEKWKNFLLEKCHGKDGSMSTIKYSVDVNGYVKLHPLERNGIPYPHGKVDASIFERVNDGGRIYVLVPHGGVERGVPDEVQSHPAGLELVAAYDGFRLITRARTQDHTEWTQPTHEPQSVMAKHFPEGHRKKAEVEALVRGYVSKGL